MGCHLIAMPTVGRHRLTLLGPLDGDLGLSHQPPGVVPAHGKPVVLEWLRHAATPLAVPRLRRDRLHPSQEGRLFSPCIG